MTLPCQRCGRSTPLFPALYAAWRVRVVCERCVYAGDRRAVESALARAKAERDGARKGGRK